MVFGLSAGEKAAPVRQSGHGAWTWAQVDFLAKSLMAGKNVVGSGKEAILDLFFKFDKSVQLICVSFKRGNGPRKLSFKWNSPHQGYINSEVTKGSTRRGHQGFSSVWK